MTALINEVAGQPDADEALLLVLDDYHLISSQLVHSSLGFLLEHRPPGLQLALTGRSDLLSMTFGLMALTFSPWVRLQVGGIWLAARGQLPWRAMRFLEDAHARGALRQAGAAYQFRHARLQEQLVARARNTQRPTDDRSSHGKPDDPAIGDKVPQASVR